MPFLLALALVPVLSFISFQCIVAVAFRWLKLAFLATEVIRPIAIFAVVGAVWIAARELSPTMVMSAQLGVMLAIGLVLYVLVGNGLRARLAIVEPKYETGLWVQTALPLLLVTLFGNYFPELMLILLGPQVSSDQIAIFNASYRVALVVTFGLAAIDSVTSPVAARLYAARDLRELQSVIGRATQLGFWGSVAALAGFALVGRQVLELFGEEFVAGYGTMMILVTAQLVRSAAGPVMALLSVTGHQRQCLVVFGSALAGAVVLSFSLVPAFGIEGAAAAVLLVTLGWSIWLHRLVVAHIGIRPSIFGVLARA